MVIKFLHSVKDTEYLFVLSERTQVLTRIRVSFCSFFFFVFCTDMQSILGKFVEEETNLAAASRNNERTNERRQVTGRPIFTKRRAILQPRLFPARFIHSSFISCRRLFFFRCGSPPRTLSSAGTSARHS